jgi:hypothetical protein
VRVGCVSVEEEGLNTVVIATVLGWLGDPANRERLLADHGQAERAIAARALVTTIQMELTMLRAQVAAGAINANEYVEMKPGIEARLNTARAEATRWSSTSALGPFLDPDADLRERWELAELPVKRDVLRDVLTPTRLGQVRVMAVGKFNRVPVQDRIKWLKD